MAIKPKPNRFGWAVFVVVVSVQLLFAVQKSSEEEVSILNDSNISVDCVHNSNNFSKIYAISVLDDSLFQFNTDFNVLKYSSMKEIYDERKIRFQLREAKRISLENLNNRLLEINHYLNDRSSTNVPRFYNVFGLTLVKKSFTETIMNYFFRNGTDLIEFGEIVLPKRNFTKTTLNDEIQHLILISSQTFFVALILHKNEKNYKLYRNSIKIEPLGSVCLVQEHRLQLVRSHCETLNWKKTLNLLSEISFGFTYGGQLFLISKNDKVLRINSDILSNGETSHSFVMIDFKDFFNCEARFRDSAKLTESIRKTFMLSIDNTPSLVIATVLIVLTATMILVGVWFVYRKRSNKKRSLTTSVSSTIKTSSIPKKLKYSKANKSRIIPLPTARSNF
ncbi:hypothetical protein SSS_05441 [Sarcoptes scabiei]|uniref:Uncharacterized protein n=1 Tax=Sarcoptes scabiei TaxID=52283 RepID=A0A834VHD4_SARSC|nr:hypothetical protein SSS_05441 [Sarcoptes scabiei]